jgi:glycine cleavage system H protein
MEMNPKEYRYSQEHEWISLEAGGEAKVGVTDYAQSQMGDVVYLDLPSPGTQMKQAGKMGEIETVKAVSDLFAPAGGEVLKVNQAAIDDPRLVNADPYGAGWLVRLSLNQPSELDALMNSDQYTEFVAGLSQEG